MGKPTGFLEYSRCGNPAQAPLERIRHFGEFHPRLDREARRRQGARCMECGVPFCQSGAVLGGMVSGCPLHNLIPEWNDLLYTGNFSHAVQRLLKTNNFPEFTGRVCPALCEAACTCGLNGEPVTIRENELGIIEDAWETGLIQPRPPKVRTGKQVAVVGSGPAGLACADQLNRRGHTVTVFEKADRAGGLLMYGIPNMKLEKHIVQRRVDLMTEEGVLFRTNAEVGVTVSPQALEDFDAVVLCCGAGQPRDLKVDNREGPGVLFAIDFLSANTRHLLAPEAENPLYCSAKGKRVVIVGGGDTGNDCVGTCIRQGCQSVIQLELLPQPPAQRSSSNPWPQWPKICKTDYGQEEAIALFGRDPRRFQTTVTALVRDEKGRLTGVETVAVGADGKPAPDSGARLDCDLLLIAAGFTGCQPAVPEALHLPLTDRGCVQTEGYQVPGTNKFSAGDMRRGQSLVVWAIAEGRACARQVDAFLMDYTNL